MLDKRERIEMAAQSFYLLKHLAAAIYDAILNGQQIDTEESAGETPDGLMFDGSRTFNVRIGPKSPVAK